MTGHAVVGLVLNYRDAARSVRCIRSLLEQAVCPVTVWDNSADDGASAAAIRAAFDARQVDIQQSPHNLGFAAGVNRGLAHCLRTSPGARVLLINNDARLLPDAVAKLSRALADASAMVAFPDIDHAGQVLGPGYCQRWSGLLSWRPHRGYFRYASGCCLLLAMDRLALPLFDEAFFMYGEDCELGWRLGRKSGALVHVGETLVEHDGAASSGRGSPFYEAHMAAAHLILARKLADNGFQAGLFHLTRMMMLLARALVRAWRYRSWVPFAGLREGMRLARQASRH